MGCPSSHEFSHSKIACENPFDCVRACHKPLREDMCKKKYLFSDKLRDGLPNVTQKSPRCGFIVKGKVGSQ
jgi:hypothetical protein